MSMKSLSIVAAAALALCAGAAQANFANGGFEIAGANPPPAESWLPAAQGYTRSDDAHTGSFSASLAVPNGLNSAIALQNSVKDGGQPPLTVGQQLTFSFWSKGEISPTGNVLFALRFLDDVGNIKYDSMNQNFEKKINPNTWTEISFKPAVVPVGATAAFVEFSSGSGPLCDPFPTNCGRQNVLIDDVSLVPEPSTYAMMLLGLAGLGAIARRRRSV